MNWATRSGTVAAIVLWLIVPVPAALSAGIQALNVPADGSWPAALSGAVWYPCAIAPTIIKFGPFEISATKDCPITGTKKWPLIVISHGRKGIFLDHRDTAQELAEAGFVVAAISHPGDNALDSSHSDDLSVLVARPVDIKRLIDYMLGPWSYAAIDPERIGLFGFSRGGFAGLVLAGANPRFSRNEGMCVGQTSTICEDVRQGKVLPLVHDGRVKALVIADPLSVFFTNTSFDEIRVPIQLWRSEHGGDRVTPESVATVAQELPTKVDFRTVPNAQHFSFLPPCPDALAASADDICTEPSNFDREAFHKEFNAQVLEFFRQALR